jgi:hypothetical protein
MLLVVALLVLVSAGSTSGEGEWVLWVKSTNVWDALENPNSAGPVRTLPTKDECLKQMGDVMDQVAAWMSGNGIHVTRDGSRLTLRIPNPPDPPRLATVDYSCIPNTT